MTVRVDVTEQLGSEIVLEATLAELTLTRCVRRSPARPRAAQGPAQRGGDREPERLCAHAHAVQASDAASGIA